jgi:serine protein kinase
MSNSDRQTTSDFADLASALDLKPVKLKSMPLGQFLQELSEHPERADTAHGLLVRAVESLGEVDIDKEPEERQPYLRMLKDLGIKHYVAFDHVRGSQRIAHKQMQHFRAAAANGYQLFLALIIKGPPGSGKSMFVDAFKKALEGQIVYAVDGCPVHENPLNLLKLLSDEALNKLAAALHLTEEECAKSGKSSLREMLAVAGEPCQHCWSAVMESRCHEDPNHALLNLQVTPMRLSSRKFGIATWTPTSNLPSALERGSRGMVDMGELFDGANPLVSSAGSPSLKILLEATNDRRLPGGSASMVGMPTGKKPAEKLPAPHKDADEAHGATCAPEAQPDGNSYLPLDAVLFGQANEGAWKAFIQSLGKDAGKFTRRFHVFTYPYNTSVTEEEMAYRDRVALMRDMPHFDPKSLTLLALLAVVSRLKPEHAVDIVQRARIYDGEKLEVKRTASSVGTSGNTSEYWTVQDLWREAAEEEALTGLDMTVMFNMLSEIIDRSLSEKRFERCVSSYEMISFLRARLAELEKSDGFTDEQRAVIKRCREKFLAPAASKGSKPGQIEAEYQRVLQRELYEVASPDFERRAEALYQRYRRHVQAMMSKQATVEELVDNVLGGPARLETVSVDIAFLSDLEDWMGIKSLSEKETFRSSFETEIFALNRKNADKGQGELIENWRTLPRVADGIRKKLNSETRARLERLLKADLDIQEKPEDERLRTQMLESFNERGYCKHCLAQALEYFKLNELWNLQS